MIAREGGIPIPGFKGLDYKPGKPRPEIGFTRSLKNVRVRNGTVQGRGGVDFDSTFGTAMSEDIAGLMVYTDSSLNATLLRIGASKVEKSTNAAAWSDITGSALTGAATDRPQWVMYRDDLYFTNEGQDRPRYWTGSSNTVEIATAPWAKAIASYEGFVFLLNVSDNGSTFFQRQARYSEDPKNDWTLCEGNELNFHETTGAVMAMGVYGRNAVVLKEDGVIYLKWIGGNVRFSQDLAKGSKGTLAPLAGQSIGEEGYIYLDSGYALSIVTANDVLPLAPRVGQILQSDLAKANVANCRSCVNLQRDEYSLFFPLDSSGGNTGRIIYNYRTGEFSYDTYTSHAWDAVESVRWTKTAVERPVGAVNTKTYTLDSTPKTDETSASASTAVSRYYDTDWVQYTNMNEGRSIQVASKFTGATLHFPALAYGRVRVSVAVDKRNVFRFAKTYDLRKVDPDDEYVEVRYDIGGHIKGEWFNIRIEFLPNSTTNPTLISGWAHFLPEPDKSDVNRKARMTE